MNSKTKRINCFLKGDKWADGAFADWETVTKCSLLVNGNIEKGKVSRAVNNPLTDEEAEIIETTLNRCVLRVLQLSSTEWGNDYYAELAFINDIMNWMDKYTKFHKIGRYFSLITT